MDVFACIIMEDYSSKFAEVEKQWVCFALNQSQACGSDYLQGQALCQLCANFVPQGKRVQVLPQLQ